jgi:hypothetical protein
MFAKVSNDIHILIGFQTVWCQYSWSLLCGKMKE